MTRQISRLAKGASRPCTACRRMFTGHAVLQTAEGKRLYRSYCRSKGRDRVRS